MSRPAHVRKSLSQTSRVALTPISPVTLTELRDMVAAAEHMPGHSRVLITDPIKASHAEEGAWAFRGMTILHTEQEPVNE